MPNFKRPELKLSGSVSENFKNFELRFHDYCIQADYRDLEKKPETEKEAYYKKPLLEVSVLRSAMPDEALQVIRYTIEPQIPAEDRKKPWIWMDKIRLHYIGSIGSSLLTDRFKFWNTHQNAHESVQEWEVKIRQAGSMCAYDALNDEMCRDKFVFGLHDGTMRTELLKTHLKTDGTPKTMQDVVTEAKALESAQKANKLISDTEKGIEEQVNWMRHKQMKLKRDPGTCHWCGDRRGPHPWKTCPSNSKTCTKCGINDHFARVCLEKGPSQQPQQNRPTQWYRQGRGRGNSNPRGRPQSISRGQQVHHLHTKEDHPADYFSDDYLEEQCYSLETQQIHSVHTPPSRKKYFVHLPMSATGNKFETLTFQVLPKHILKDKPALLSGSDCEKLGLIEIHADEIFSLSSAVKHSSTNELDKPPGYRPTQLKHNPEPDHTKQLNNIAPEETPCSHPEISHNNTPPAEKPAPSPSKPIKIPAKRCLPPPGRLTQDHILQQYAENFEGLGYLGPPVHFEVKSNVSPVQMPIHRVPVAKRIKEKEALDEYAAAGIITKEEEPTSWCSNEVIKETPKKTRLCIEPSQTINKAILRPICQMPTLNEQLHKLCNAKCFSLVDVRDGFLHIPLDDESALMTTMHTSYGRYRWLRLPFGISSAPEEFQKRLMTALEGLDGVICIADDILVFGEGEDSHKAEEDHDRRFVALMERCSQKNIRLNPSKLQFKLKEVKFMGNIITHQGMQADSAKVSAITSMPAPRNKAGVQRFIGMANYLSPYCPNLSTTIRPLTQLTRNDVSFMWAQAQEDAFTKAKTLIATTPVQYFSTTT